MSGQIKLTPEELRTSALKYSEGSSQVGDVLSSLQAEQQVISDNWAGDSFQSFEEQFQELQPKITEFIELLQDINEQLTKVADIIQETDADIAAQIRS